MNGIEFASIVRKQNPDYKVVIMASSSEWESMRERTQNEGLSRFLPKPLFLSAITDSIYDCLGITIQTDSAIQENTCNNFDGRCILLAEDVEINREIVIALLEPTGIEIDCAENGKVAVDMFTANPDKYSMIFMDLQMPEMDGYTATKEIRASGLGCAKNIPIVAMTANVFKEDIDRCLEVGMNGHIGKPLDFDEVVAALGEHLTS